MVAQASIKTSLTKVIAEVKKLAKTNDIEKRREKVKMRKLEARKQQQARFDAIPDLPDAMAPGTMMRTLAEELPGYCLVYDESITSTPPLQHYLQPSVPGSYILSRGGCIGVGWPGAVGASFAEPKRQIIAVSADGSAIFALQCLWTAVRYRRNIIFIVCNNQAYRILKINMQYYWQTIGASPGEFPFMNLNEPNICFSELAAGFGMQAITVSVPNAFRGAIRESLANEGPSLIEVILNGALEQ
ncbi:MAG: hypothetical protein ACD_75C02636G0005 [uncultured bacterium]|nr:MAG: hypothetical protein ACD_75C02636G0005 [uncultured bacterium]